MMTDHTKRAKMNGCRAEQRGWHPEHIKAAIRAKGCTLAQLAARLDCSASLVTRAIRMPKSERVDRAIARFLGVAAHVIWPERYAAPRRRVRQEAA